MQPNAVMGGGSDLSGTRKRADERLRDLLLAAPSATRRTGRRLGRAGMFVAETVVQLGREAQSRAGAPIPPDEIGAKARRASWVAENLLALHGIEVRVEGEIPRGRCVLVANHISYLDPVAIVALAPNIAIAKSEVSDWPLLGDAMKELGVLFFERGNSFSGARVLRQATRCLHHNIPVLAFPEGTTTTGGDVLPFRRGVFGIARHTGAPIVPVTVSYDAIGAAWVGDESFVPHYLRTVSRAELEISVHFGAAILPDGGSAEELAERARKAVREGLPAKRG